MITKEQLNSIEFYNANYSNEFYDVYGPEFMFDIKSQTLYEHCEVDGVKDALCKVTDFEKLKEVLNVLSYGK